MSYGPTVSLEKGLGRGGWYAVFFPKKYFDSQFSRKKYVCKQNKNEQSVKKNYENKIKIMTPSLNSYLL